MICIVYLILVISVFGQQICKSYEFADSIELKIQRMIDKGYKVVCMTTMEGGWPILIVIFEKVEDNEK